MERPDAPTPFAEEVRKAGAKVYIGHHPRNLKDANWVVQSSAIAEDNPGAPSGKEGRHPRLQTRGFSWSSDGRSNGYDCLTHGKTTTTGYDRLGSLGAGPRSILYCRWCSE